MKFVPGGILSQLLSALIPVGVLDRDVHMRIHTYQLTRTSPYGKFGFLLGVLIYLVCSHARASERCSGRPRP